MTFANLKTPGYDDDGLAWVKTALRRAIRMAKAYQTERRMRVQWQERAADYREVIIDHMRRRMAWSLAERVQGRRDRFRLIGHTNIFQVEHRYRNVADIDCVYGVTLDRKFQTAARVADIIWLAA